MIFRLSVRVTGFRRYSERKNLLNPDNDGMTSIPVQYCIYHGVRISFRKKRFHEKYGRSVPLPEHRCCSLCTGAIFSVCRMSCCESLWQLFVAIAVPHDEKTQKFCDFPAFFGKISDGFRYFLLYFRQATMLKVSLCYFNIGKWHFPTLKLCYFKVLY